MAVTPPVDAILFDKDGTLLDFQRTWTPINIAAATLAADNDPVLAKRLLAIGGTDPATRVTQADSLLAAANTTEIAAAWIAGGSPFPQAQLVAKLDALFTESATKGVPVTDLADLFARLRGQGLRLGIASSDSEGAIRAMAAHFGLMPFLSYIAGYDSGHGPKPEPGMLLGFGAAIATPPARIAMVGDNLHDMVMGTRAGAGLRIGVLTGTGTRDTLTPACDLCLPSIADLPAVLFG